MGVNNKSFFLIFLFQVCIGVSGGACQAAGSTRHVFSVDGSAKLWCLQPTDWWIPYVVEFVCGL